MPRRRRPKLARWRRVLMTVATLGQSRRRRRRNGSRDFFYTIYLLVRLIVVTMVRWAWKLIKAVVYYTFFYDSAASKQRKAIETERKHRGKRLRDTKEWKRHYRDARAIFVRTAEQALGPGNLKCSCCPTKFPTHGDRGFHVDHIYPVASYPELSFDVENFQLLCETCNLHKSDSEPMVADRRPVKMRLAMARARRAWLRKHGGDDPIDALIKAHAKETAKPSVLGAILRTTRHA